ncbi:hypothetical protein HNQ53_003556, partial [Microbulbifer hydrolyticus]|nr:hypothetical protein [Microbulbifer hydrolyticus]
MIILSRDSISERNIASIPNARNRGDQCYAHFVRNWERSDQHKMCIALGV